MPAAFGMPVPEAKPHRSWLGPAVLAGVLGVTGVGGYFALRSDGTTPAAAPAAEPAPIVVQSTPAPAAPEPTPDPPASDAPPAETEAPIPTAASTTRAAVAPPAADSAANTATPARPPSAATAAATPPSATRPGTASGSNPPPRAAIVNADLIAMSRRGMADSELLALVRRSPAQIDLSPAGVSALRSGGVSDGVIVGLGGAVPAPAPAVTPPPAPRATAGAIRVKGPAGGDVFVDRDHRGMIASSGEVLISEVPFGAHQVRVVVPNHPPHVTQVAVTADGEAVVAVPAPAAGPSAEATRTPARPAAASTVAPRTFTLPSTVGSRTLRILPNEVQYERRDSRGRLDDESFTLRCDEVQLERGTYGMSLRMRRRVGKAVSAEARGALLDNILRAYTDACGARR